MDEIIFCSGSVPISVVAKVYQKDTKWVREGIISGWLPIGIATRGGERITNVNDISIRKGRVNYYVSPKKLYEETGYLWKGKSNE